MAKAKSTTPKKTVAVKKTPARPARSSVKKTAVAAKTVKVEQTESVKTPISTKKNFLILGALIIAIIAVLLYQNKGLFVVATVNGKPISRLAVVNALEKQSGKTTLDSLVTETLILSEAQKQGKSVSQEDIDAEIGRIEESVKELGQPLDELLKLQGLTREQLIQQIKVQKLVEKLLEDQISVKDEEVSTVLSESQSSATEALSASDEAQLKKDIKSNLSQQKISEKFPQWLEELKAKSSIKYFKEY